jgi:hypothetical protein
VNPSRAGRLIVPRRLPGARVDGLIPKIGDPASGCATAGKRTTPAPYPRFSVTRSRLIPGCAHSELPSRHTSGGGCPGGVSRRSRRANPLRGATTDLTSSAPHEAPPAYRVRAPVGGWRLPADSTAVRRRPRNRPAHLSRSRFPGIPSRPRSGFTSVINYLSGPAAIVSAPSLARIAVPGPKEVGEPPPPAVWPASPNHTGPISGEL